MPSTFLGLSIASSSLAAQQTALDVAGHNIGNANDRTYTRQQAVLGSRAPVPSIENGGRSGIGSLGAGVDVTMIRRLRDRFTEDQILGATASGGEWKIAQEAFDRVVGVFGEPSDTGIGNDLNRFWNSWQELSLNPENLAARNGVVQAGQAVANSLSSAYKRIEGVRDQRNTTLSADDVAINQTASDLAGLNEQIQRDSGFMRGARDLTWNYASVLTAIRARNGGL